MVAFSMSFMVFIINRHALTHETILEQRWLVECASLNWTEDSSCITVCRSVQRTARSNHWAIHVTARIQKTVKRCLVLIFDAWSLWILKIKTLRFMFRKKKLKNIFTCCLRTRISVSTIVKRENKFSRSVLLSWALLLILLLLLLAELAFAWLNLDDCDCCWAWASRSASFCLINVSILLSTSWSWFFTLLSSFSSLSIFKFWFEKFKFVSFALALAADDVDAAARGAAMAKWLWTDVGAF